MILFWFLLGIALILAISRYNESDKLFWTLFISFIGAFGATTAVVKYLDSKERDKVEYVTSAPTQALYAGSHTYCVLADSSVSAIREDSTSKSAGKEMLDSTTSFISSKVSGGSRDQPVEYIDDS